VERAEAWLAACVGVIRINCEWRSRNEEGTAMRFIGAASIAFALALTFAFAGFSPAITANHTASGSDDEGERNRRKGQAIFRYDTFGDEQLWTDVLRMHEVIATVPPTALAVGLKVDVEASGSIRRISIDGSAPDLLAVVNHYDQLFGLNLTAGQKGDLVEFLKSL
jgi:hypothetical protein